MGHGDRFLVPSSVLSESSNCLKGWDKEPVPVSHPRVRSTNDDEKQPFYGKNPRGLFFVIQSFYAEIGFYKIS